MIKYLGSKRKLIPQILEVVGADKPRKIVDLFSGTSRVGSAFKKHGFQVFSNDHNAYAHCIAQCYIEADREDYYGKAAKIIEELKHVGPKAGYFTKTFCENARFIHPDNGALIDAIRENIEKRNLEPILKAVVLTSLLEAADRVDSTCGIQMAYLKQWAKRALKPLELRVPELISAPDLGACKAYGLDALAAAKEIEADIFYLDPPYNQHSYLGNYHIWETLVRWDKPEAYGVAQKRIDVRSRKSPYNRKREIYAAFDELILKLRCKEIVVSFSDEGYLSKENIIKILAQRGEVHCYSFDYKRYVGATIGIHNLKGEKVGKITHTKNQEYLFKVEIEK